VLDSVGVIEAGRVVAAPRLARVLCAIVNYHTSTAHDAAYVFIDEQIEIVDERHARARRLRIIEPVRARTHINNTPTITLHTSYHASVTDNGPGPKYDRQMRNGASCVSVCVSDIAIALNVDVSLK
jgi:hypothetical protein